MTPAQKRAIAALQSAHKLAFSHFDIQSLGIHFSTFRWLIRSSVLVEIQTDQGPRFLLTSDYTSSKDASTCPTCFGAGCSACEVAS